MSCLRFHRVVECAKLFSSNVALSKDQKIWLRLKDQSQEKHKVQKRILTRSSNKRVSCEKEEKVI